MVSERTHRSVIGDRAGPEMEKICDLAVATAENQIE